ncbi:uncharacterized protein TRIADDRAFT_22251 [Trichoplax adhaerens]|uniref:inositol-1,4-bisphosphate 1-phosphatase n=1 Tax=Trichoplax adhaerens TaxID=10228 RepID=B3RTB0_TRIAD|nr:hypothetical protein TRIADDRAFT_22251 [Trichoplax adhaerens]EDV26661.1 hypothetical protein TRIADDRAFT_22251 [Trichoplax adhaerens]|eukprot:XP_002110657.1 hypothetical protein TRIADDRAFT_22251 [Trichoplax adhaerens]
MVSDFMNIIINCAEKAAVLARVVRSEAIMLKLLIEEKTDKNCKNDRFVHDFKTLVDVLIQEMVKHEIAAKFPCLTGFVHGEEDNTFTNAIGESVIIEIKSTAQETANVLRRVLNNNEKASQLLAEIIHGDIQCQNNEHIFNKDDTINIDNFGIWIDPLDGTNEYISQNVVEAQNGIYSKGLQCVTVLIGIYHRTSGSPIAGVINQPFHQVLPNGQWQGRSIWALCYNGMNFNSNLHLKTEKDVPKEHNIKKYTVLLSGSESKTVLQQLNRDDISIRRASGAGYKLLCVIDDLADAYVLSKGSTYKWDTCAPHAILLSMKGSIINMENADESTQIVYNQMDPSSTKWNNSKGIIAFKKLQILEYLKSILS